MTEYSKVNLLLTELSSVIKSYTSNVINKKSLGFNVFGLVSDLYYRENFHSDIIAAILDPNGNHDLKEMPLENFISFININAKGLLNLNIKDFQCTRVVREKGRIDILIKDIKSKRAIIIENKINDAPDQERQVPRYFEYCQSQEYEVVAIVYLSLFQKSVPSQAGWSSDEKIAIENVLLNCQVVGDSDCDLISHWLSPCVKESTEDSTKDSTKENFTFVTQQYLELLKHLGRIAMGDDSLKQLVDRVIDDGTHYEEIQNLVAMYNSLPNFRARSLLTDFSQKIFRKTFLWPPKNGTSAVFDGPNNGPLSIDVCCELDSTIIIVWNRETGGCSLVEEELTKREFTNEFDLTKDEKGKYSYTKKFKFPSGEQDFKNFLKKFLYCFIEKV